MVWCVKTSCILYMLYMFYVLTANFYQIWLYISSNEILCSIIRGIIYPFRVFFVFWCRMWNHYRTVRFSLNSIWFLLVCYLYITYIPCGVAAVHNKHSTQVIRVHDFDYALALPVASPASICANIRWMNGPPHQRQRIVVFDDVEDHDGEDPTNGEDGVLIHLSLIYSDLRLCLRYSSNFWGLGQIIFGVGRNGVGLDN